MELSLKNSLIEHAGAGKACQDILLQNFLQGIFLFNGIGRGIGCQACAQHLIQHVALLPSILAGM
jgi:hypothetical protein